MIVESIWYRLAPERVEAFLAGYAEAQTNLQASAHCLGYELSQCTDAREVFVLRIEWASHEAHLKGFRVSAEFPPFLRAIGPFVENIEEMRHYDVTPLRWSRAPS